MEINLEELIKISEETANKAHINDRRKNGGPYIDHPRYLVNLIVTNKVSYGTYYCNTSLLTPYERTLLICAAWLHDVFEDHPDKYHLTFEFMTHLFQYKASEKFLVDLIGILDCLTKRENEPYVEYIYRIIWNGWARIVKTCDLIHNLSDLEKGAKRDKYQLTFTIVAGRFWETKNEKVNQLV